jgi:LPS O-antigen subunit length determinant protein (WzzB/FepE family)
VTSTVEPKAPPRRTSTPEDIGQPIDAPLEPATRLRATFRIIRQRFWRSAAIVLGVAVAAAGISFLLPPQYTADSSFFPAQQTNSQGALASAFSGMSTLLGALGGSSSGSQQPQFFIDLLKSRSFQDSLAISTIEVDSTGTRMTVENFLVKKAKNARVRRESARSEIKGAIRVTQTLAGIVQIKVEAPTAQGAAGIANRAIEIIDQLNIDFRRREAGKRRAFNEEFLDDVAARLDSAEHRLEGFMLANHSFESSPVLKERYTSLYTEVTRLRMLQESVEGQVENERLTEYNNAAVVTNVDRAAVPVYKSAPRKKLITAGAMLVAMFGVFWWAFWLAGRRERD